MSVAFSKIAIVGPGAIGLYYGTLLALAGAEVRFLLRSDLATVRARGITVRVGDRTLRIPPERVGAFGRPAEIGPVDLVVVTLKTTANDQLATLLPPLLGPQTAILTLQNGLGADELLAAHFGAERVLGGLSFIASNRVAPGEVVCFHPGSITLGEFGRPAGERARALAAQFEQAGVKCSVVDNLREARWRKLIWNVPFNGLAIATGGLTTDRLLADPQLAAEVRALMDELAAAARAQNMDIPEAFLQEMIDVTPGLGAYKPSSLLDWLAGREVEVEAIWGEPLRRARAAGADTPRLALLYAQIRQQVAGAARR
ncbi:MAG TPA: 2-dehydropantoate 2-reductase [Opitutaceae bacterium]|nr:2-dehydropantoate 2-reductase [Opitutaceae bacterium]